MSHETPPEDDPRLGIAEAEGAGEAPAPGDWPGDWPDGVPDEAPGASEPPASEPPLRAVTPQPGADSFMIGADAVRDFVHREWKRKLDYRLKKEVWTYSGNQVSILFEYEWHDADADRWMLTHGEEHWQIAADGLPHRIKATSQDIAIAEIDRWILPKPPISGPTPVE